MKIDMPLYRGNVNKNLRVLYNYNFEPTGQYQTVVQKNNGSITINPAFSISISEGFERNRLFIPSNKYYPFATLLENTIKVISENLYTIFPDINSSEFEIDHRALERFQTEKAMTTCDMTAMPDVWVDEFSSCYPAIKIDTTKCGCVTIPFEDAIPVSKILGRLEPYTAALDILRLLGKID